MLRYPLLSKKQIAYHQGFSLVELMVVIFIVSLTAGILLSSYGEDRAVKELEANSREFAGALREAQNYALTGKRLQANTIPCGYKVKWGNSSYDLIYYYRGTGDSACQVPADSNTSSTVYTRILKGGALFQTDSGVTFTLPHAVPEPSPGVGVPLPIILEQGSAVHVVCLYEKGRLSDHKDGLCPS